MKHNLLRIGIALLVLSAVGSATAGDWKYPLGITYTSSFSDVLDYHEAALGVDADFNFPIGVSFHPFFEFEKGHRLEIDVGPIGLIFIQTNFSDDKSFISLPIGATYGYVFARDKSVAPYIRAGVSYDIASGDFVDGSSPGAIGAIGLEMARHKRVSFGLEAAYSTATIDLKDDFGLVSLPDEEVETGFMFAFRIIF